MTAPVRPPGVLTGLQLSDRQLQILRLRAEGLSGPQIARKLCCAVSTVDWHERVIRHVLGARNMTHAVHLAHVLGVIGPYPDCGDRAAYLRHLKRGEPTDPACRAANAAHAVKQRAGLLAQPASSPSGETGPRKPVKGSLTASEPILVPRPTSSP